MIRKFWLSKTNAYLKLAQIGAGILVTLIGILCSIKYEEYQEGSLVHFASGFLAFNQSWAKYSIPFTSGVAAVATYLRTHFGTDSTWSLVTGVIEEYKRSLFDGQVGYENDPDYFTRVTLYKYVSWRWALCYYPWTGWMVPVARGGHTTHSYRISRWQAPRDRPDKANGIVGRTYVSWRIEKAFDLPDLNNNVTHEDQELYCQQGCVDKQWVENRIKTDGACPTRSIVGIPIEVKGERWGVLVIDSRNPQEIQTDEVLKSREFITLIKILGKILES